MTRELAFFELGVEDADKGRAYYEGLPRRSSAHFEPRTPAAVISGP